MKLIKKKRLEIKVGDHITALYIDRAKIEGVIVSINERALSDSRVSHSYVVKLSKHIRTTAKPDKEYKNMFESGNGYDKGDNLLIFKREITSKLNKK